MSELPRGWIDCAVGDLAELVRGVSYDKAEVKSEPLSGYVPILRATNIDQSFNFEELVFVPNRFVSDEQMLRPGDIVIAASSGSKSVVGKAAQFSGAWEGSFGAFCMGIRPFAPSDPRYLGYFFQSPDYRQIVSGLASGSNINNLKREHISGLSFKLPPAGEQGRIVEKLDEYLSDLDAGIAALERARANLKRYRAAVLKAAVEGRLTEKWRAAHPDAEPAEKLLERILAERRKKWEEAQLRKYAEKGQAAPKGWKDRYVEPAKPDVTALPALPEGWCWATIEQCSWEVTVGHVGPMKERYEQTGLPFLRSQNVRPFRFDREGLKFISKKFDAELSKSRLFGGEVLAVRSGNIGDACVFPNTEGRANCADLVITRLVSSIDAGYVVAYLNSPVGRTRVIGKQTGSALPHFNVGAMARSVIPLPPTAEQLEIATNVAERLSQGEEAFVEMERSRLRASRLRQAILKRAFEGKLVPQDPKDEPAGELLGRIRAGREAGKGLIGQRSGRSRIRKKIRTNME